MNAYDRRIAVLCRMLGAVIVTEHRRPAAPTIAPARTARPLMVPYSPDDHSR